MYKEKWDFEFPASYRKTEEMLERINKNLCFNMSAWNRITESIPKSYELTGVSSALEMLIAALDNVPKLNDSLFSVTSLLSTKLEEMPNASSLLSPSLLALAETVDKLSKAHSWQVPVIDWEWMSDELSTFDIDEEEMPSELITSELRDELEESVASVAADPSQAQEIAKSKFAQWQAQHPFLAYLFLTLLATYMVNVLSGVTNDFLSGILRKPAKMYEEPTSTSSIVVNVEIDQNVTIINTVPYYYEVVCTDLETGEQFVGYIYKPNIEIEETEDKTATAPVENHEGTSPTESVISESVPNDIE